MPGPLWCYPSLTPQTTCYSPVCSDQTATGVAPRLEVGAGFGFVSSFIPLSYSHSPLCYAPTTTGVPPAPGGRPPLHPHRPGARAGCLGRCVAPGLTPLRSCATHLLLDQRATGVVPGAWRTVPVSGLSLLSSLFQKPCLKQPLTPLLHSHHPGAQAGCLGRCGVPLL